MTFPQAVTGVLLGGSKPTEPFTEKGTEARRSVQMAHSQSSLLSRLERSPSTFSLLLGDFAEPLPSLHWFVPQPQPPSAGRHCRGGGANATSGNRSPGVSWSPQAPGECHRAPTHHCALGTPPGETGPTWARVFGGWRTTRPQRVRVRSLLFPENHFANCGDGKITPEIHGNYF